MVAAEEQDLISDVTESEFDTRVIAASRERVVVVDFWAPWCAPCRVLGPLLEKVVRSYGGSAALAKVNTEECPAIASRWRVQALPTVKIFRDGQVAGEFMGALPEAEIRRHLSQVIPSESDDLVEEGDRALSAGSIDAAGQKYREALALDPDHDRARVRLAEIALKNGDEDTAREMVSAVSEDSTEQEAAAAILARVEFAVRCRQAGARDACAARAAEDEDNLDAQYDHGCCLAAAGEYPRALDLFLKIVERDKHYADDAAKNAMLRIFAIVGQRSELADEYRGRLASALY